MDSVTDHLIYTYGGVGVPSKFLFCFVRWIYYIPISFTFLELSVMREVSTIMGDKYPNMFQIKGSSGKV